MLRSTRFGQIPFGLAMIAFGVQNFFYGEGVESLESFPAWLPGHRELAYLTGIILVAAGIGLVLNRMTRLAALSLAVLLSVWVIALHLSSLVAAPRDGGEWTASAETLALCAAAWMLAAANDVSAVEGGGLARIGRVARYCFAGCLLIFCILHFVYTGYVASVIPAWIPGHVVWAYVTGLAFLAAGLSITTGVLAPLGASLLATMFGLWVILLHTPRVVAASGNHGEWTSLIVALGMCGSSWIVAGSLEQATRRAPHAVLQGAPSV